MNDEQHSSFGSRILLRGFGRPTGLLGRVGGWMMARSNAATERHLVALADLDSDEIVAVLGPGPGIGVQAAAEHAKEVIGIDPSDVMLARVWNEPDSKTSKPGPGTRRAEALAPQRNYARAEPITHDPVSAKGRGIAPVSLARRSSCLRTGGANGGRVPVEGADVGDAPILGSDDLKDREVDLSARGACPRADVSEHNCPVLCRG